MISLRLRDLLLVFCVMPMYSYTMMSSVPLKSFLYLISDFLFPGSRPPLGCFVFFEIVSQVPGKLRLEEELEETGTVEEQECGGTEASWGGGHMGCVYQMAGGGRGGQTSRWNSGWRSAGGV